MSLATLAESHRSKRISHYLQCLERGTFPSLYWAWPSTPIITLILCSDQSNPLHISLRSQVLRGRAEGWKSPAGRVNSPSCKVSLHCSLWASGSSVVGWGVGETIPRSSESVISLYVIIFIAKEICLNLSAPKVTTELKNNLWDHFIQNKKRSLKNSDGHLFLF